MSQENRFSLFNLMYRPNKDGKGVKKEKKRPMNFINFFITLPRRFGKLVNMNLLTIVANFPLIFPLIAAGRYFDVKSTAPAYDMFAAIYNLYKHSPSPAVSSLWGMLGLQVDIFIPSKTTYIVAAFGLLIIFTFGWFSTGLAYITRNLARGESVSVISDFFYAIKRNVRQGLILGIIDIFLSFMLVWDIIFFYANSGSGLNGVMFILSLCMAVVYFFMRYYMYNLLVTFDLSILKILKNSLIFSFLGIWRNLLALVAIIFIAIVTLMLGSVYFPLGLGVAIICGFSLCAYVATYAAYPKIKEYMIDPYYKEEEFSYFNEADEEEEEFSDSAPHSLYDEE